MVKHIHLGVNVNRQPQVTPTASILNNDTNTNYTYCSTMKFQLVHYYHGILSFICSKLQQVTSTCATITNYTITGIEAELKVRK
jgi:hypothetical protein